MKSWFALRTFWTSGTVLGLALVANACVVKKHGPGGRGTEDSVESAPIGAEEIAHTLLGQTDFSDGVALPWTLAFTPPAKGFAKIEDGAYCLHVENKGANKWDAQVRHREMTIENGHTYTISFKIWASQPTRANVKIGMFGPPYTEYWVKVVAIGPEPLVFTERFTMQRDTDPTAELAFHAGGALASAAKEPFVVCIDDIVLSDPAFTPKRKKKLQEAPKIAVNQVGYFPGASKFAAYANPSDSLFKWELVESSGKVVATGQTLPFGEDPAAGESVHVIDFSGFTRRGLGYSLQIGADKSFAFDIENDLYHQLKYDALHYFYHNRSGIAIQLPYAEQEKWQRPAGHLNSDKDATCAPDVACDYKLDASGGWYDAGDHGKYVVNGGITAWTLMNLWERTTFLGSSIADFADGKMNIPENQNGQPDLLDEARWEIDWMLRMQVPEGKRQAGMVHHKIHDSAWTALGISPHEAEEKIPRFLRPPSTAATLNVAAVGAQCARVYRDIDDAFATRCLTAAEKAWRAAKANPTVYAPASDSNGGGPYDDKDVSDDFYWAAAELWVTTHKPEYKKYVLASPHHEKFRMRAGSSATSMTWGETDSLGKISMGLVPKGADAATMGQMRMQVADAADEYLKYISGTGYSVPFKGEADGKYPWGSNSFIVNNALILALAHDFTGQRKYFDGAFEAAGYLLGRNPLGQCYVSGYGSKPLQWPHHRFWAFQVNKRFPTAPPGCLSGGPNSSLQDPYVQAAGLAGCAPQKCFVDHIEAWSVNEISINWNAPLAWLSSFLDEKGPTVSGEAAHRPAALPTEGTKAKLRSARKRR